jgi:hypothetical protein
MGNQDLLRDCAALRSGPRVRIPLTYQTYYVQPKDTCTSIEWSNQIPVGSLKRYNSWLDAVCTNMHSATDFYSKYVCISPEGGAWSGTIPPTAPIPKPNGSDGYSRTVVTPPSGVIMAGGTTLNCGKWHIVLHGDTCATIALPSTAFHHCFHAQDRDPSVLVDLIALQNAIEAYLSRQVNPSLAGGIGCDTSPTKQTALCVGPTYTWRTDEGASQRLQSQEDS